MVVSCRPFNLRFQPSNGEQGEAKNVTTTKDAAIATGKNLLPKNMITNGKLPIRICISFRDVFLDQLRIYSVFSDMKEYLIMVQLPDGRLMGVWDRGALDRTAVECVPEAAARYSTDDGYSWSEAEPLFKLPKQKGLWGQD